MGVGAVKLTYWVAEHLKDSSVYSIRCKTRKEVIKKLEDYDASYYDKPKKVTVEYQDSFDLLEQCLSECSRYWE